MMAVTKQGEESSGKGESRAKKGNSGKGESRAKEGSSGKGESRAKEAVGREKTERREEAMGLVMIVIGTILLTAGNIFMRWSIGDALDKGTFTATLLVAGGILVVLSQLLLYTRQILYVKIQKHIYHRIQLKVLRSSMETLEKNDLGVISTCYMTDVNQIDRFFNRILGKAVPDLAGWLITVGLLLYFDVFLGIAAIAVTVLPTLFLHRMSRPVAKGMGEYQKALEVVNQKVASGLDHMETIKASCKEEDFLWDTQEKLDDLQKKKRNMSMNQALLGAPMLAGSFGTIIFLTALSGWLVLKGRISPGQLLTVVTLTETIVSFVMSMEGTISAFRRASVSRERLKAFLGQEEEQGGSREVGQIREIVFDKIGFSYPGDTGRETYKGFTERWQQGRIIFIKGSNGEGKSTLVKLLTGIYSVSAGQILLNGIPVQEYGLASLREKIVVVPQDNILFRGSIRDNLTCGRELSAVQIEEACEKTGIHKEIIQMPNQYNTVLSENGGVLSGGQKQRLCVARALLRKGDVYLFDEPTSALDRANRERFMELLSELAKDKIVVVITHDTKLLEMSQYTVELKPKQQ